MKTKLFLVVFLDGVSPEVWGPYASDERRVYAARNRFEHHGPEISQARLNIARGVPSVAPFAADELEGERES